MGKNKVTPLSELSQEDLLAKATELEATVEEQAATIEKLEADTKAAIAEKDASLEALGKELAETAKANEAAIAEKDATIAKLEAEAKKSAETIGELIDQNEVKDASIKSKRPVVKIAKSTYGLRVPKFYFRQGQSSVVIDAETLNKDSELAELILKEKPQMFTKLK